MFNEQIKQIEHKADERNWYHERQNENNEVYRYAYNDKADKGHTTDD